MKLRWCCILLLSACLPAQNRPWMPVQTLVATGAVVLEVAADTGDFLLIASLSGGMGSNPVGLDRGTLGGARLVHFRRVGDRLYLIQKNLKYRSRAGGEEGKQAVDASFARSVLWSGPLLPASTPERWLIDVSSFLKTDLEGWGRTLSRFSKKPFRLAPELSFVEMDRCRALDLDTELVSTLTFRSEDPGREAVVTTPDPTRLSLRQHVTLARLPDPGFEPRSFDPRCGSFSIAYEDLTAPLGEPTTRRLILRHRLEKTVPGPAPSRVRKPLVYYVDSGAPEPIRSALIEGASWWKKAFEAAGYVDAFRVEVLPDGVDPMDLRYNVILWVHRATRGWSYGSSVVDPRTGEILKALVRLGSLRARQDHIIAMGLSGAAAPGSGDLPREMALARIRQLAAHEVGHTLGFAHNFAASVAARASVMDYPAPLVTLGPNRNLDFSRAYARGIGAWDVMACRMAYEIPGSGQSVDAMREALLEEARERGMTFISDADARAFDTGHAQASLWDNGADPVEELRRVMAVRRIALARFTSALVPKGRPLSDLEIPLVPLYLHHRYQLEATAKLLGGALYEYAMTGGDAPPWTWVDAKRQRAAMKGLLEALQVRALSFPEDLLRQLPPMALGSDALAERFPRRTGSFFDPVSAAETLVTHILKVTMPPARLERMVLQHAEDAELPGADELLAALSKTCLDAPDEVREGIDGLLARMRRALFLRALIDLDARPSLSSELALIVAGRLAAAEDSLRRLAESVLAPEVRSQVAALRDEIRRHREGRAARVRKRLAVPPGSPIGGG